jgi:hypothetical protein
MTSDGTATCPGAGSPDVWWTVSGAGGSSVTISTCSLAGYDTVLTAHSECPGTEGNQLACNDDSCGLQSSITFNLPASGSALVRLGGFGGQSGPYAVSRN